MEYNNNNNKKKRVLSNVSRENKKKKKIKRIRYLHIHPLSYPSVHLSRSWQANIHTDTLMTGGTVKKAEPDRNE